MDFRDISSDSSLTACQIGSISAIARDEICHSITKQGTHWAWWRAIESPQKGSDLDLLEELPAPQADARRKCLTLIARLQRRLGDQPIDVLVTDPEAPRQRIHEIARSTGVLL